MTEYVDGMSIYGYTHEESVDAFKTFAKVYMYNAE